MVEARQVIAVIAGAGQAAGLQLLLGDPRIPSQLAYVLVEPEPGGGLAATLASTTGRPLAALRGGGDLAASRTVVLAADSEPEAIRALFGPAQATAGESVADAFLAALADGAGPDATVLVLGADPAGARRGLAAVREAAGRVLRIDAAASAGDGLTIPAAVAVLRRLARQRDPGKMRTVDTLRARLRQQAAIAGFGGEALRSDDLETLLHRACELVARGLDVSRAKVLERLPDGRGLLVRAGVGWEPGVVGHAVIGTDRLSAPGYALLTGEPVVAEDLGRETRFEVPELLRRHGIVSSVNVLIRGERSRFGVLEVDSTRPRSFGRDDINFLHNCANLVAAAIDRLQASRDLQRALAEKQVLLYELQHRVKNSLQEVAGLVGIERRKIADPALRQPFDVLQSRLEALGIVYRRLYLADRHAEVELGGYLAELTAELMSFHAPDAGDIALDLRLDTLHVTLDVALPMALIACEFVVNSFRHAFPGGRGRIGLTLTAAGDERGRLTLEDDGVGLPREPSPRTGWGLRLIGRLVGQVDGELHIEGGQGVRMEVTFPRLKPDDVPERERSGP